MIHFGSTNRQSPRVDLGEALLLGQAPDKGLYMPEELPSFSREFLRRARDLSYPELAVESYRFMEKVNRFFGGISNVRHFIEQERPGILHLGLGRQMRAGVEDHRQVQGGGALVNPPMASAACGGWDLKSFAAVR